MQRLSIIIFFILTINWTFGQKTSVDTTVFIGKWTLTKFTETEKGETWYRKIKGVDVYEPKTDSTYKEFNQNDTIGIYEFHADRTFTLTSIDGFGKGQTVGKWRVSDKDSSITLFDSQRITAAKGPLPKSDGTLDLKLIYHKDPFLVLTTYVEWLDSTIKLYYKKVKD